MWASVATGCLSTLGALCARREKEEDENDRECVGGGGARFWGSEGGGLLSFGPSGSQRAHLVQMPRIELSKLLWRFHGCLVPRRALFIFMVFSFYQTKTR